jgi:hypothetical protein
VVLVDLREVIRYEGYAEQRPSRVRLDVVIEREVEEVGLTRNQPHLIEHHAHTGHHTRSVS